MTVQKYTGAQYMAEMIKKYGTTHVFFMEAILRATMKEFHKLGVKPIMAHSEIGAGYMADGYARMTHRPGVCFAQSVGAANLAAGIGDAWLANTPLISFTGKKPPKYQYKNAYQELDHEKMFSGVTKFHGQLTEIEQLPFLLRLLYREATSGKARPVHLDLPGLTGSLMDTKEFESEMIVQNEFKSYPSYRALAEPEKVEEAVKAICSAERPIIVAGRGAIYSGAEEEILELATKYSIPVITSPDGKCIIDENNPLWGGIVGFYGMNCSNSAVSKSDLVIYVGTQTADQTTNDWTTPTAERKVIQIDLDGSELGKNYPNTIGLMGDAKSVIQQLIKGLSSKEASTWAKEVRDMTLATLSHYDDLINVEHSPIMPERLMKEIEKALPKNGILVSDTGYSAQWTSTFIRMKPSQKYIRSAGSLGWAFPGSLGVKCGAEDRPVICLIGDTGFYYYMGEMETALKYNINSVTVINNNRVQAQSLPNLTKAYPEGRELAIERVSYPDISFAKIAEEMGLFAIRVENPKDIAPSIEKALESGRPSIIEVITHGDHLVPDPLDF